MRGRATGERGSSGARVGLRFPRLRHVLGGAATPLAIAAVTAPAIGTAVLVAPLRVAVAQPQAQSPSPSPSQPQAQSPSQPKKNGPLTASGPKPLQPAGPKALSETLSGAAKADYDAAKLLVGDGDWAGAEIKLQAAYDKSADPRLLWNIAACEKNQRHYARTVALVQKYLAEGGDLVATSDRTEATALLQAIESFTVKLTVSVNEPGADIAIDDQKAGISPLEKPVVVDIGARKIEVHKAGYRDWSQSVPIGGSAEAKVDVTLQPEVHEGHIVVTTQADGVITIDGQRVGDRGRFEGRVKSGGHTLRVEAPGMVSYQSEVVLNDDENRSVDVQLQKVYVPPPPEEKWPGFEIGISEGPGVRLHGDKPWLNMTRLDLGWHASRRTDLGIFLEGGEIDASRNCGTDVQSAATSSPLSLDPRWSFSSCVYAKAGLQVLVHILPKMRIDPWLAFEPGFRITHLGYTVYSPLGGSVASSSDILPAIDIGGRVGLDWHPLASYHAWAVGAFGSLVFTFSSERPNLPGSLSTGNTPETGNQSGGDHATYFSLFFGLRTSLAL